MARKLSVAQKTLLKARTETDYDDLPHEIQDKINKLNMYENLESDATRFLNDQYFERQHKMAQQGRLKI
jgi:hypothetical protein